MSSILAKLKRLRLYLKFYFEPNEKALGAKAYAACKAYYGTRPVRSPKNLNPHPIDYTRRMDDFRAFQTAYKHSYRHDYAKRQLESLR
jgi:hypothetical protein